MHRPTVPPDNPAGGTGKPVLLEVTTDNLMNLLLLISPPGYG
ncbi:MAG: hypothetical protein ACU85E_08115 [Gammaproteobacteria bacterium]